MKPVISGFGLVTPLGRSATATWTALLNGQHISTHTRLNAWPGSATADRSGLAAECKEEARPCGPSFSRVCSLAIEAADEAVRHAGWTDSMSHVAIVTCTSKGSVESWMDRSTLPVNVHPTFGLEDLSRTVAQQFSAFNGPRLTMSAACASGLIGLIRACLMIESGEAKRVLVVGAEASVHPLFLASFHRLGVLPPAGELCRPFDVNRSGFLMSEAAAAVCVDASPSAPGIVAIDRYAMGGDATHLTRSDSDGRVLRHLLNKVIGDRPIGLVHAHGTGTVANDLTELNAIEATVRNRPSIYSHKGALGHSLGASGLVSVVLNCMSHQSGILPGNVTTDDAMPTRSSTIPKDVSEKKVTRSLVNSAGFGGPTAVVGLISVRGQDP